MELLGDVGHVESHYFLVETVLVSMQDRCMVCAKRTIGSKIVWTHLMVPLGDEAQVEARFGHSDIELMLTQDRCKVCVECTIGSEIVLDTPDGTPR